MIPTVAIKNPTMAIKNLTQWALKNLTESSSRTTKDEPNGQAQAGLVKQVGGANEVIEGGRILLAYLYRLQMLIGRLWPDVQNPDRQVHHRQETQIRLGIRLI
jgi:hypothetical protein